MTTLHNIVKLELWLRKVKAGGRDVTRIKAISGETIFDPERGSATITNFRFDLLDQSTVNLALLIDVGKP